jgi:hypothetical protein
MNRLEHIRALRPVSFVLCLLGIACTSPVESGPDLLDPEAQSIGVAGEALLSDLRPPPVPASIAVPAGNKLYLVLNAVGDQVYECRTTDTGQGWVLKEPDADLLTPILGRIIGSHYAGPTWEALDGSTVVGARVAGVTPDASTIPWLLLQTVSRSDTGLMSKVSYIQRLNTTGGLAPSTGCDAGHVGALAPIHYTATYYFFRASPPRR